MKKYLALPIILFCFTIQAQEKLPFIDYELISEQVAESSQNGDLEKPLELLAQINKNDSIYCTVLVSKSYYLVAQKKYDEAIAVTDEGLLRKCGDTERSFLVNKAVALLNQEKFQKALTVIEEGIERFPKNILLWYNKGLALESLGKIEAAVAAYQEAIILNPLYKNSYLKLGNICYKQELISQALMCYNMYLLLQPDADNAINILSSLDNIAKSKNENVRNPAINISPDDEAFEDIDLIISNRIALNENYKTGNDIDIALVRQNHALMASLDDFSGNGGFWDTKLVPFYKWIRDNDYFDVFTYTLAYSAKNENYKKIVEKNVKEITSFFDLFKSKYTAIIQTNKMPWYGQEESVTSFYDNGYMSGMGRMEQDHTIGPWEFYNANGRLTAKGSFDSNGDRTGKWTWFNDLGNPKEHAWYSEGKLNGENQHWYPNNQTKLLTTYKNGNLEGGYTAYNEEGALLQKKNFKAGDLNGAYQTYFQAGLDQPEVATTYAADEVQDKVVKYYADGSLSSEINFKAGKRNGPELNYYMNGKLSVDLNNTDGLMHGPIRKFYANGNPMEVGEAINGYNEGEWKTYYYDGTVQSDLNYKEGYINGLYKYYDYDGKLTYEYEYRKGEIIAYKFVDKNGQVLKEDRKKGGEFFYVGYSPQGNITSEGLYDIKGGKKGEWKFYNANGVLTYQGTYNDNKTEGAYRSFYQNGETQSITPYVNDTITGYYTYYHKNGKLKTQGWYKNNNLHGEWRNYSADGVLSVVNFYHKGSLHGEQQYFDGEGRNTGVSIYEYGNLVKDIFYDEMGTIFETLNYVTGAGTHELTINHFNGKPKNKLTYLNGVKHGRYLHFDYYGRKRVEGNYLNGEKHGAWVWYYENGSIESTSHYINGQVNGKTINYYEDGTVENKYQYDYGSSVNIDTTYYRNGKIDVTTEYENDQKHGRKTFYGPSGKLQLIRFYDHDRLIGYSYPDKQSKVLPMIPIKNESGMIRAYYDNGKISREMEFQNGELVNAYKQYYYDGQLAEDITYFLGEVNGLKTAYYANGTMEYQKEYLLGDPHGLQKEYFDNGQLKEESHYLNGNKNGVLKKYAENGKLTLEEKYFNGDITSSKTK